MRKNAVYIPSFDAKDVYLASQYENETRRRQGVTLKKRDGTYNLRRFVNAFDYSLDQIKLRELCELGFMCGRKEYTPRVINLTFKYKACEWNRVGKSIWLKAGICEKDAAFDNCVYIRDGELAGIVTDKELTGPPVEAGLLPSCFAYKNGKYTLAKNPKAIRQTSEIRADIYRDGFMCDGVHYVRWKRSSGSARVGKCLFVEEALYPEMHRWELCGLPVEEGGEIDLAALESYLSLPTSSIIDTLTLCPENILVIDDFESVFTDNVVAVSEENGQLKAERKTCEIKNSIWDGQGLISPDVMGTYSSKGMVLLRNRYFKCCCFNTNIQEWFADKGITDISQLNGRTRAKNISDIKLITTPSSIKYLKFGTLDQWLDNIDSTFGLVKYEKKTHFFDGRMVQTHYQLLNTLQMTSEEVRELLTPTFDYMTLIREEPAVLRYHIKYPINDEDDIQPAQSKNDIVYKMLGINDKFAKTKLYNDFRTDILKSFTKSLKLGHVLVNGNYSTLLGNGLEMLQAAIGKFSGESEIGIGNIHSTRFEYGRRLLGSRSPHITCSNVWLPTNVADEQIDRYFNLTPEILYLNSIGENVLNRLSGCDFDSDSVLLTDNEILIKAALRNDGLFPIAMSDVKANKTKRRYTDADKADLDVKTSNNLIGDIINTSQEANTLIWHTLNNGGTFSDIEGIYNDVCILNVMSGMAIDAAKKEFNISFSAELKRLRDKYQRIDNSGRRVKPNFFGAKDRGKGYYDCKKRNYLRHDTAMDYLQHEINAYRMNRARKVPLRTFIPFSDIVDTTGYDHRNVWKPKVEKIIEQVRDNLNEIKSIYMAAGMSDDEKRELASLRRQDNIESIGGIELTRDAMIYLLKHIEADENKDVGRYIFNTLFGYPNTSFYELIISSREPIPELVENPGGEISIYGVSYSFS